MLPYDRWEGYEAERQRMLRELQSVRNVVFLSTDVHATLVNDARFQTLEPGGPQNSNILDVTVGSAATENYRFEIDRALGQPGTGTLVDTLLRTPSRRAASGCGSIVDQFSYGEVRVTANRLTITPRGSTARRSATPAGRAGRLCCGSGADAQSVPCAGVVDRYREGSPRRKARGFPPLRLRYRR